MEMVECIACEGDGWGWKSDGLVVEGVEGACPICEGDGQMLPQQEREAARLHSAYVRAGVY
jgi:hypothetical protein